MGPIDFLNRLPSEDWPKPEAAGPPRRDPHDHNPRRKKKDKPAVPEDEFEVDHYEHAAGDDEET